MPTLASIDPLYPPLQDCQALERQLNVLSNDIQYYRQKGNDGEATVREAILTRRRELFKVLGCPAKIAALQMESTKVVLNKYSEAADVRIGGQTDNSVYVYMGIAAATILGAILIIKNAKR